MDDVGTASLAAVAHSVGPTAASLAAGCAGGCTQRYVPTGGLRRPQPGRAGLAELARRHGSLRSLGCRQRRGSSPASLRRRSRGDPGQMYRRCQWCQLLAHLRLYRSALAWRRSRPHPAVSVGTGVAAIAAPPAQAEALPATPTAASPASSVTISAADSF
jgi:hypothetical protein